MKVLLDTCVWGGVRKALCDQQQAPVCLRVLVRYGSELEKGAIVTAEYDRVRIRLPGALHS